MRWPTTEPIGNHLLNDDAAKQRSIDSNPPRGRRLARGDHPREGSAARSRPAARLQVRLPGVSEVAIPSFTSNYLLLNFVPELRRREPLRNGNLKDGPRPRWTTDQGLAQLAIKTDLRTSKPSSFRPHRLNRGPDRDRRRACCLPNNCSSAKLKPLMMLVRSQRQKLSLAYFRQGLKSIFRLRFMNGLRTFFVFGLFLATTLSGNSLIVSGSCV